MHIPNGLRRPSPNMNPILGMREQQQAHEQSVARRLKIDMCAALQNRQ